MLFIFLPFKLEWMHKAGKNWLTWLTDQKKTVIQFHLGIPLTQALNRRPLPQVHVGMSSIYRVCKLLTTPDRIKRTGFCTINYYQPPNKYIPMNQIFMGHTLQLAFRLVISLQHNRQSIWRANYCYEMLLTQFLHSCVSVSYFYSQHEIFLSAYLAW